MSITKVTGFLCIGSFVYKFGMCQFSEYSDIYKFSLKMECSLHNYVVYSIFFKLHLERNTHRSVNFLYRLYIRKHPSGPGRELQCRKGQENQRQSEAGR